MVSKKVLAPLMVFVCILSLTLAACGPLDVQVEPLPTRVNASPTTIQVALTLTATPPVQPTNTLRVVTITPPASPVPPVPTSIFKPGTPVKIIRTRMTSLTSGWGIGQVGSDASQRILATADGGKTWQDRSPHEALANAPASGLTAAAYFASAQTAWVAFGSSQAVGDASLVVWSTTDGGRSWQKSQALDFSGVEMEFRSPSDLGFLDSSHGWIMIHLGVGMSHDYFAAFTTADGGKTWTRVLEPNTSFPVMGCYKSGLTFTSSTDGWLTGNCPGLMPKLFLFHTRDGGATWTEASLPVPSGKPANYFAQSGIGCGITSIDYSALQKLILTLACTNTNTSTGMVWLYSTEDSGTTWEQNPLPVLNGAPSMISPDEGFLVGTSKLDPNTEGGFYHTLNGGADWTLMTSTAWTGTPDFFDSLTGWVVAVHNGVSAFVITVDGGRTWKEIKPVIGS